MVTDRITKPVKFCMFYFISIFGIYLHTLYQLAVAMSANVFQAFWLLGRFERSAYNWNMLVNRSIVSPSIYSSGKCVFRLLPFVHRTFLQFVIVWRGLAGGITLSGDKGVSHWAANACERSEFGFVNFPDECWRKSELASVISNF